MFPWFYNFQNRQSRDIPTPYPAYRLRANHSEPTSHSGAARNQPTSRLTQPPSMWLFRVPGKKSSERAGPGETLSRLSRSLDPLPPRWILPYTFLPWLESYITYLTGITPLAGVCGWYSPETRWNQQPSLNPPIRVIHDVLIDTYRQRLIRTSRYAARTKHCVEYIVAHSYPSSLRLLIKAALPVAFAIRSSRLRPPLPSWEAILLRATSEWLAPPSAWGIGNHGSRRWWKY